MSAAPEAVALMNDVAAVQRLALALSFYGDPKNWAIHRNGTAYPDAIWIGPGAAETAPAALRIAREALEEVFGPAVTR